MKGILLCFMVLTAFFSVCVRADARRLPKKYSLVKKNQITPIKDQGITGCCWAFATIKSIESNCIKKGYISKAEADFSESHLTWYAYHATADTSSPVYGDGIYDEVVMSGNNSPLPNWKYNSAGSGDASSEDSEFRKDLINNKGISSGHITGLMGDITRIDRAEDPIVSLIMKASNSSAAADSEATETNNSSAAADSEATEKSKKSTADSSMTLKDINTILKDSAEDSAYVESATSMNSAANSIANTESVVNSIANSIANTDSTINFNENVTADPEASAVSAATGSATDTPTETPVVTQTPNVNVATTATPGATATTEPVILRTKNSTSAYTDGGSAIISMFSLATWTGVADEISFPFNADNTSELTKTAKIAHDVGESGRYAAEFHLRNAECYDYSTRNAFKKAIKRNGAADIAIFYDETFLGKKKGVYNYNQIKHTGKRAYQYANHCVTIVGWNDNYSKNNFLCKPSKNGAWLVANSYGTTANNNGYFWLSYYDPSITDCYSYVMDKTDRYDNIVQYDGLGWGDYLAFHNRNIPVANIFKVSEDHGETLKAVGLYTLIDDQKYKIKVYRYINSNKPTAGTRVETCTVNGVIKRNGFHTIELPDSVALEPGEKYSIVVTYKKSKQYKKNVYAPFEGKGFDTKSTTFSYASHKGESFFYYKGQWYDSSSEGYNNAPIKAYTLNS
ncbi:MAG: hypothetical protein K6G11_06425 [Lachnospiraceae bacterium]|nr:hypothetical protein [Lachnospiraceae bacterium]